MLQIAVLAVVNPSVCLSIRPAVTRWHCVKMTYDNIMRSSLEDRAMTVVSSFIAVIFTVKFQGECKERRR